MKLEGVPLPSVNSFKYLGSVIDGRGGGGKDVDVVQQPSRHFSLNLAKIPPNQVIADFGRGNGVESESE